LFGIDLSDAKFNLKLPVSGKLIAENVGKPGKERKIIFLNLLHNPHP